MSTLEEEIWDWFLRWRWKVPLRSESGFEDLKAKALTDLDDRLTRLENRIEPGYPDTKNVKAP